ncbi:MAG: UDP-glucose 4-epimerase GalE [Neomegalonema sp.]|nr:UDP-glucose 4-epimerase GalE [Neomegalonema sp.]
MAVLVTGGAGYIGSHMVLDLLEAGEQVVVLDNLVTGLRESIQSPAEFVRGDVADTALVSELLRSRNINAILHFAGSVVVPESQTNPVKYYRNNTANSLSLFAAAIEAGVKHVIFSSTAAVYGMAERIPVVETDPVAPISPYGMSKLMTEQMLRDLSVAHDLSYVVLRYFNVAGADPEGRIGQSTPGATHLIKVACQAALGLKPELKVFGQDYNTRDGTGERDFIHVADLVRAHSAALRYLRAGGESDTFNCGYGRGSTVLEVIDHVERASNRPVPYRFAPRRPGDIGALTAGNAKILERLDWKPELDDLNVIVKHAYGWEARLAEKVSGAGS